MNFDLSEVTTTVQAMINGFLERLPYLAIALIVFVVFLFVGKGVRAAVRSLAQRSSSHRNLGLVLGRLAQSAISSSVC